MEKKGCREIIKAYSRVIGDAGPTGLEVVDPFSLCCWWIGARDVSLSQRMGCRGHIPTLQGEICGMRRLQSCGVQMRRFSFVFCEY